MEDLNDAPLTPVGMIRQLQDSFLRAVGQTHRHQVRHDTGELSGGPYRVYKLDADGDWCFKSEIPISTTTSPHVAAYLAGLQQFNPDFEGTPYPGEQMDAMTDGDAA